MHFIVGRNLETISDIIKIEKLEHHQQNNNLLCEQDKMIWNSQNKILYRNNPYITYNNKFNEMKNNILKKMPNLNATTIIITSPFLSCIQTGLLLSEMSNFNFNLNNHNNNNCNMYVDYRLGEINNKKILSNKETYLSEKILKSSEHFLNRKFKILDNSYNECSDETIHDYNTRIMKTMFTIHEKFADHNVIIISHRYCLSWTIDYNEKQTGKCRTE